MDTRGLIPGPGVVLQTTGFGGFSTRCSVNLKHNIWKFSNMHFSNIAININIYQIYDFGSILTGPQTAIYSYTTQYKLIRKF